MQTVASMSGKLRLPRCGADLCNNGFVGTPAGDEYECSECGGSGLALVDSVEALIVAHDAQAARIETLESLLNDWMRGSSHYGKRSLVEQTRAALAALPGIKKNAELPDKEPL